MFGEPFIAHPAECARVHATGHPHFGTDYNRDQHDDDADDQQHMVRPQRHHGHRTTVSIGRASRCSRSHSARDWRGGVFRPSPPCPQGHECVVWPVHSGTAQCVPGPYTCKYSNPSKPRWNNPHRNHVREHSGGLDDESDCGHLRCGTGNRVARLAGARCGK